MSRVLLTGGAGTIGAAIVKRLLADPAYELRVSDQRPAPQWMRESCEVHTGDLRVPEDALAATKGCTQVIHLAAIVGGIANFHRLPHTLTEVNNALYNAVIRAALELEVERFVYVSSSMVFERAELFPTPENYLPRCPVPLTSWTASVTPRSPSSPSPSEPMPWPGRSTAAATSCPWRPSATSRRARGAPENLPHFFSS